MRAIALVALLAACAAGEGDEAAGRSIYRDGVRVDGSAVRASILGAPVEGAAIACARCHGARGEGSTEAGVAAPPLGPRSPIVRTGASALARALVEGAGSRGTLHPAMPRFDLGRNDLADLLAYLRRIDRAAEPGVGARAIRIGIAGGDDSRGREAASTIAAALAEAGEVHRRRVVPVPVPNGSSAGDVLAVLRVEPDGTAIALPGAAGAFRVRWRRAQETCSTFDAFAARRGIRRGAAASADWAGARALVEALRRAGAAPTRPALEAALRSLRGFDAGCDGRLQAVAAPAVAVRGRPDPAAPARPADGASPGTRSSGPR